MLFFSIGFKSGSSGANFDNFIVSNCDASAKNNGCSSSQNSASKFKFSASYRAGSASEFAFAALGAVILYGWTGSIAWVDDDEDVQLGIPQI